MILEVVSIKIHAGQSAEFKAAYLLASKVISKAKGYISHEMQRSVDVADHYLLQVKWQTRDDHVIGFRESPLFVEWRKLIGPFFASTPEVEHYEFFA
jgi:heme-degrading monooxygenase HmoA